MIFSELSPLNIKPSIAIIPRPSFYSRLNKQNDGLLNAGRARCEDQTHEGRVHD